MSLARGLAYYTGVIYEIVLIGANVGSVGGGGRYDGLVGRFSPQQIPSVGGSIGIERILSILEDKWTKLNTVRTNSCECFVASIGKNLVNKRFEFCA